MEVIIHTVDHNSTRFEVDEGNDEEQILAGLHPDKAFGHHHLVLERNESVSMIVSSKVTYVELRDLDRTQWPFYDVLFEAFQLSDAEFDAPRDPNACFHAELFLADGKTLKLKMEPLETGGVMPCPAFVMDQLLSRPSLHVHGKDGKILLINVAQILRCDFRPCPHTTPNEPSTRAAVHVDSDPAADLAETKD